MSIRVGFLVVRLFPMYALMLATDALRLANKYAHQRSFDWVMISDTGEPVEASNGIRVDCDQAASGQARFDYLFVVAGDSQGMTLTRNLRRWLTRIGRSNTVLGAIDSGAFLLAECGLLARRKVTVHSGSVSAFREQYPDVVLSQSDITMDARLLACAGGLSTLTLMLSLIRQHAGPAIVRLVSEDMNVSEQPESRPLTARVGDHDLQVDRIESVVRLMKAALEEPIPLSALAEKSGLSSRQLTRQFLKVMGCGPMEHYKTLRVNHAKQLLSQSELSISQIATAAGFNSLSSFSRCFASQFGCSPRQLRTQLQTQGNAESVPISNQSRRLRSKSSTPT